MKKLISNLLLLAATSLIIQGQVNLATDGSKATASEAHASGPAAYAFDADTATGWVVTTTPVQWIQYDFESPAVVDGYAMHYLVDSVLSFQPTRWIFCGSDNGTDWTDIDTITDDPIAFVWEQFVTQNTTPYRYYRLNISAAGSDTLAIGELQLYSITLPSVTTGDATYIEAQLASCSGQVTKSGGTPVLERGICYNTLGNPTLADSYRFSSAGVGSYNVVLPDLTPNTTYYFRAFATNVIGTEYATEVKTFTTLKLNQTITFPVIPGKTYGDPDFDAGASSSSGLTVLLESSNTDVALVNSGQIQIVGAGSSVITASQPGNTTYNAAIPVDRTLTVVKKVLTSTADNMEKTYGDANPVFTISYSGFVNGEDSTVLDIAPVASSVADEFSDAGTYFITLTNGSDDNYSFNHVPGILTVNKAPLSAVADNKSKTYGEINPEFTISYSGFVNGDDLSDIDALPVASTIANETCDAGIYTITASGGDDNNYTFVYTYGILTIYKAQLIAAADNREKEYGDDNPEFTVTYTGFRNNDSAADLDSAPVASSEATDTSDVGNYIIAVGGGSDNNYNFTYTDGTLAIEKATLHAVAEDAIRYVGEPNPEFAITYEGFKHDDTIADIDVLPAASCLANDTSAAGTYTIEVNGGVDNNYRFEYTNGILTVLDIVNTVDTDLSAIKMYPNPASERICFNDLPPGNLQVLILNMEGKAMLQGTLSGNSLDISEISQGLYLLRIYSQTQILHQKKIVIE